VKGKNMLENPIEIIYLIEFFAMTVVRSIHTSPYRTLAIAKDRKSSLDVALLGLTGIGMILPLLYIFSSLLDFADYPLPGWLGWVGAVIFAVGIWMLWRSHADLGRNWTPTLGLREDHKLVTGGIFKSIRHPMYSAHLLWAVANILMLPNWLAGFTFLIISIIQYATRINDEEQMMIEQFGDEYLDYMKHTGRFFPRNS
jgi:protein-S-isoprenylcysteine O-methyltransferase Ste14